MTGIPVLMYHALEDAEHPTGYSDPADLIYTLYADTFRSHLAYLQNHGYQTVLFNDLEKNDRLSKDTVILTFDDGHVSNYEIALPLLKKFGFRAEFFITTGWIGEPYFLSSEQIKEIDAAGMGIGSHGVTHTFLNDLSIENANKELSQSKKHLEDIVEKEILSLSFPGGRRPANGADPFEIGYHWACTSQAGLFDGLCNCNVPRVTLKRDIVLDDFIRIVRGAPAFYWQAGLKSKVLGVAKAVLGNKLYRTMHRVLSTITS